MRIVRNRPFVISLVACLILAWLVMPTVTLAAAKDRNGSKKAEEPDKNKAESADKAKDEKEEAEEDRYFAVLGGNLYTVTGPVLKNTDILVKNGIIQELGQGLKLPDDCETLDAHGMTVYPGLVAVKSSGIIGREPPENSTDVYGLSLSLGLAAGLTTVVTGNTAAKLTYGTVEDMVLKRNLFITLPYSRGQPKLRHDLWNDFRKVQQYLREVDAYELKKAQGVKDLKEPDKKRMKGKLENYLKLMTHEATAIITATKRQQILDVCELAEAFGFDLVINQSYEAWTVPGALGRAGVQVMLSPRQKQYPNERTWQPSGWNIESARILHEHGVNFAILPSRAGISLGGITGRDLSTLPMEAAYAVRGGLSEKAAIEAITIDAARMLRLDSRIGSIEVGKDADLIVCDGDLLHYNTLVQWSIVNGRIAYDKEKESLFAHIRPRDPSKEKLIDFWPRKFGEMPDYEAAKTEETAEEPAGEKKDS